jgi:hypothetical protein
VGVVPLGPTTNGAGKSAGADNFTTCGFDGSTDPPPQAVSAVINNSEVIFLMVISLVRKLLKKKLSKQALEFGNPVLITFCKFHRYL